MSAFKDIHLTVHPHLWQQAEGLALRTQDKLREQRSPKGSVTSRPAEAASSTNKKGRQRAHKLKYTMAASIDSQNLSVLCGEKRKAVG